MIMEKQTLNRAQRRKVETRQKLVNSAVKLLSSQSLSELTVRAITEEADVGYGTFYLHFSDRDDIVWEIISSILDQTNELMNQQVSSLPFLQKEFARLRIFFDFVSKNQTQFLTVLGENSSPTLAYRYRNAIAEMTHRNFKDNNYQSDLTDVPLETVANFYSGAMLRLATWWIENENEFTPEQMAQMVYKMVFPNSKLPF